MRLKISAVIMGLVIALSAASLAKAAFSITQVTSNTYEDLLPQIKGNCLVWQGRGELDGVLGSSGHWEIFFYNIASGQTTQISDEFTDAGCDNVHGCDNLDPQTDGRYVVWWVGNPRGAEIWYYDTVTQDKAKISPAGGGHHSFPVIANGRVAWIGSKPEDIAPEYVLTEVYLCDLNESGCPPCPDEPLTDNNMIASSLRINEEWLTWLQTDQQGIEHSYVYNLDTGATMIDPTDFKWEEDSPQEDGNLRVSTTHDGQDFEIIVRGGPQGLEQITDNSMDDRYPRISGSKIAWMAGDGKGREIFLADLCGNEPITGSVSPSVDTLWPPKHDMIPVTIDASALVTHDPDTTISITSVEITEYNSEGENIYDENDFEPDVEITGNLTLNLRSERSEDSTGRTYTITVTASDCSGDYNFTTEVVVPYSKGKKK